MEVEHPTMPPRCMRNQGVTAWPKDIRLPKPEQELRKTEKSVHLNMKETRYTADSTSLTTPQESRVSAQPATRRLRSAYHPHHLERRKKRNPPPQHPPPNVSDFHKAIMYIFNVSESKCTLYGSRQLCVNQGAGP